MNMIMSVMGMIAQSSQVLAFQIISRLFHASDAINRKMV